MLTNHPGPAPILAASLTAALAVITGGTVLLGWALDITLMKSILPGWVSVKPNTALNFILAGIALYFSSFSLMVPKPGLSTILARLARLCGWLAGLIGLLTLGEYAFDWNPGIDQWLFPEPDGMVGTKIQGRMAPETALCFLLLAKGLELARGPHEKSRAPIAAMVFGLLVTALALAAILTYFTPDLGPFGWFGLTIMAVPTAILFAVLGATLILIAWRGNNSIWSLGKRNTAALACGLALLVIIGLTTARSQVQLHATSDQLAQFAYVASHDLQEPLRMVVGYVQLLPLVMADRTQLVQLFQNLIGNAIKFCQGHAPRVRVTAVLEKGRWRFSVTDNGIGIAPEYRGQLFAIFKRLHTQREYPGTGVGLAICKRIVERHGGEIGIDAAPGGGSVFWFTVPEEASV